MNIKEKIDKLLEVTDSEKDNKSRKEVLNIVKTIERNLSDIKRSSTNHNFTRMIGASDNLPELVKELGKVLNKYGL